MADSDMTEKQWDALAHAIIGSGTYLLQGKQEAQIDALIAWMRKGRDEGFDWRRTYLEIHEKWWRKRSGLFPPDLMDEEMAEPTEGTPADG